MAGFHDFGLKDGMSQARVSTVRMLNIALILASGVCLFSAIMAWIQIGAKLSQMYLIFSFMYFALVVVNGWGFHNSARVGFLATIAISYFIAVAQGGFYSGTYVLIIAIFMVPFLIFSRFETSGLIVSLAFLTATGAAAALYTSRYPPWFNVTGDISSTERVSSTVAASLIAAAAVYFFRKSAFDAQVELFRSRQRLQELLTNTLPDMIARRLSAGERLIADSHAEATILFADIVDFSELSARVSPTHLVELLNELFSRLDEAATRNGIEKIKTIGDCYMAAAGVLGRDHRSVEAMAEFALETDEIARAVSDHFGQQVQLRVGISTGPVIAGVIGRNKYSFDLWGETVNLASRLETSSTKALYR